MLYIGLYREKHEKIFLSETIRPSSSFDIWYVASPCGPLQVCLNYAHEAKNDPALGSHALQRLI